MTRASLVVFVAMAAVVGALAQGVKPAEWLKYDSEAGAYSVTLPAKPEISQSEYTNRNGIKVTNFTAQSDGGPDGIFAVAYFDTPPGTTLNLEEAKNGSVEKVKGTIVSEKSVGLQGNPGIEAKVTAYDGGLIIDARWYVVAKRCFVIMHLYTKDQEGPAMTADTKKFFDSFSLKK